MNQSVVLFVYGSLMKGYENNRLLESGRYIGTGVLEDYGLYQVDWYPGIIQKEGDSTLGELYEIPSSLLGRLDELEAEGELYSRKRISVKRSETLELEAYVYVWLRPVDSDTYIPPSLQPWNGMETNLKR